jgi:hypothetical protein
MIQRLARWSVCSLHRDRRPSADAEISGNREDATERASPVVAVETLILHE